MKETEENETIKQMKAEYEDRIQSLEQKLSQSLNQIKKYEEIIKSINNLTKEYQ